MRCPLAIPGLPPVIRIYPTAVLLALAAWIGWWLALLAGGLVLIVQGAVAAGIATAAKWLLVGRVRPSEHPLWSTFVWRNELADTALEVLAAPWFARPALGTPALNIWLRSMGARIGPCLLYTSPSPRDGLLSRMPSSA